MRKLYSISILLFIVMAFCCCHEYEMIKYQEDNAINFLGDEAWAPDYTGSGSYYSTSAELEYEFNFGINEKGENLKYDTIRVAIALMGEIADYDRKVTLTTRETEDELPLTVILDDVYTLPADTTQAICQFVIERPAQRNVDYAAEIVFDYENSDFSAGALEYQSLLVTARDTVNLVLWGGSEEDWENDEEYFGAYSNAKARYLMTRYGCISFEDWRSTGRKLSRNGDLITDLETYQAACESDSTLPVFIDENTGEWIEFPVYE